MPYRTAILIAILFSVLANSYAHAALSPELIKRTWDLQPGFSETEVLSLSEGESRAEDIPLTLVVFKDSGWSLQEVTGKLARTIHIYSQCGVRFNPVLILSTRSAFGPVVNRDFPAPHLALSSNENGVGLFKPVVYFAASETRNRNYGGYSWRASAMGALFDPQKRNTVLLYRSFAMTPDRSVGLEIPGRLGNYEVLAHELAHVLMDLEHSPVGGHIMSEMEERTNVILPEQCDLLRRHSLTM